ncbi:phage recombination protein Bet [Pasteurella multocida]|uniref:phage recombination protein Bet n=1 Tax=Pasteurella multocida TaxID=747 RepID=UPI00286DD919|nr:phage recombination protein Bet [Pasteurella multocida]
MSTALQTLTNKLADRFEITDGSDLMATLKATAFKGNVSDSQMTALLIVANQYGLNPWTKEVYAFPDRQNGIVPVVGVDGWARIINENPCFDGMEFDTDDEKCTCRIFRKDRARATEVTEYMSECYRDMGPWKTHPKRMLRHKAMIQCARLAFGFTGIYDKDEAERIVEDEAGEAKYKAKSTVINTTATHIPLITQENLETLETLIAETATVKASLLSAYGVKSGDLQDLTNDNAKTAIKILKTRQKIAKQASTEEQGEEIQL